MDFKKGIMLFFVLIILMSSISFAQDLPSGWVKIEKEKPVEEPEEIVEEEEEVVEEEPEEVEETVEEEVVEEETEDEEEEEVVVVPTTLDCIKKVVEEITYMEYIAIGLVLLAIIIWILRIKSSEKGTKKKTAKKTASKKVAKKKPVKKRSK